MHGTKRYHNTGPMGQNQWWKVAQLSVTLCNEKWFGSNHSNGDPIGYVLSTCNWNEQINSSIIETV